MTTSSLSQAYQFYQQNLRGNALSEVEAVLAADPTNAEAHNLRGAILEGMGQRREALAAYEAAVRYAPNYAAAQENATRIQRQVQPIALPNVSGGNFVLLNRLAGLAMIVSWVVLVIMGCATILVFGEVARYGLDMIELLAPLFVALAGLLLFLLLLGFGQGVRLLLTIENSNRQNTQLLQSLMAQMKPQTPPDAPVSPIEPIEE